MAVVSVVPPVEQTGNGMAVGSCTSSVMAPVLYLVGVFLRLGCTKSTWEGFMEIIVPCVTTAVLHVCDPVL